MTDVKSMIAGAHLPERSVPVCLKPDLTARLQELERDLNAAEIERVSSGSLAGGGQSRAIAERIAELREQMVKHTLHVRLRALPRRKWRDLCDAHPARPDNEEDKAAGVNADTFFDALIRACAVDPVLDEEDWAGLDEVLSDGQWQELANAAWGVNRRDVDVPFSPRASRVLMSSEPGSSAPSDSASALSGSKAGSRSRKPPTTTTKPAVPPTP
jgi:hypothetical protein